MASCARIVCDRTRIACCGQSALARLHEMVTEVKVDRDERKAEEKLLAAETAKLEELELYRVHGAGIHGG